MTDLNLEPEDFYRAAQAFLGPGREVRNTTDRADSDTKAMESAIGNDEMAQAFRQGYTGLRGDVIRSGGLFADGFTTFRDSYVDANSAYIRRDETNGEYHARIGEQVPVTNPDGSRSMVTLTPVMAEEQGINTAATNATALEDTDEKAHETWYEDHYPDAEVPDFDAYESPAPETDEDDNPYRGNRPNQPI